MPPLFAVLSVDYEVTGTGVKVTAVTDTPCHLWFRWSNTPWDVHLHSELVRGTQFKSKPYYCIVAYEDNEQDEAGDTLTHTFTKEPWAHCETRYFHFWGEIGGQPSPSESCLLKYHRVYTAPPPPVKTNDRAEVAVSTWLWCQYWNANCQSYTPDHNYTARRLSVMLSQYEPIHPIRGPFLVKLVETNTDCWLENILFSYEGYSTDLPGQVEKEWLHLDLPNIPHISGKEYKVVAHTILGWEEFNYGVWRSKEALAAMLWWGQGGDGEYPRGYYLYGCNFRDSGGLWYARETVDLTFIIWE